MLCEKSNLNKASNDQIIAAVSSHRQFKTFHIFFTFFSFAYKRELAGKFMPETLHYFPLSLSSGKGLMSFRSLSSFFKDKMFLSIHKNLS